MNQPLKILNFRASQALIDAANATARQNCQTLSAVLRQFLTTYAANGTK